MANNFKPLVLGTGLNGLVGSKIVNSLSDVFTFDNLDIAHPNRPVDITDEVQLQSVISSSQAKVLIHCAAFTDVTAAWLQNGDKSGPAYRVNVIGTENIARVCQNNNIHLIHLSTAYVFDGEKKDPYVETDSPQAIEWYGQTKLWAEEAVMKMTNKWTILRIDQPFRSDPFTKLDIVRRIAAGLKTGTLPPQFKNHFFGPTFIDDLARVIKQVIVKDIKGLYHATNNEAWTDFDFAHQVAKLVKTKNQINAGDLEAYIKTSQRPYQRNTALNSDKLYSLFNFKPTPIKKAISACQI